MMHHYMTNYLNGSGQWIAESWIQLNAFKWCFVFSDRKIVLKKPPIGD